MSLRTAREHATFTEMFAKQQEQEQYNSEPARLIRENERLIKAIDEEQRALSLHEHQHGRKDPHLNLPLPKFGKWTAQEIEDRVTMSWNIFKADHLTAKKLALSPRGMVTLGSLMDANPGDYSNPNVIKMLFDRALRTGALKMGTHVIDTSEPAPAPEPEWSPVPEPEGLPRHGVERERFEKRQHADAVMHEVTTSPLWQQTVGAYISRTKNNALGSNESQLELYRRVLRSKDGLCEASIVRNILSMYPEAATAEQRQAREDEQLSAADYVKAKRIPVLDVRGQAPRLRAIQQPED